MDDQSIVRKTQLHADISTPSNSALSRRFR